MRIIIVFASIALALYLVNVGWFLMPFVLIAIAMAIVLDLI